MEIFTAISTVGLVTLATELAMTSLIKKCVITKMINLSDGFMDVAWQMGRLGFKEAKENILTTPPIILKLKDEKEIKKIQSSLLHREEYQELHNIYLFGNILVTKGILSDFAKINNSCEKSKVQLTTTAKKLEIIENYSATNEIIVESECKCMLCKNETLRNALFLLETIQKQILKNLIGIEKENLRYNQSWISFLNDSHYFKQLKLLNPLLEKAKDDLFKAAQFYKFLINAQSVSM